MEREVLTLADLAAAIEREQRPKRARASEDDLAERAVAALATLRGLSYADKQKVIRRMAKMLRPR